MSAAIALIAMSLAVNLGQGAAADEPGPVVRLAADDPAMSDAEAAALRHFDRFLSHVLAPDGSTLDGAAVKVAIPTGNGQAEVIWIAPFARVADGEYLGIFANTPRSIQGANEGDAIAFKRHQIRDWSFVGPDAKLYGSFTTRVLLSHIRQEEAAQIAAILSELPIPNDW